MEHNRMNDWEYKTKHVYVDEEKETISKVFTAAVVLISSSSIGEKQIE